MWTGFEAPLRIFGFSADRRDGNSGSVLISLPGAGSFTACAGGAAKPALLSITPPFGQLLMQEAADRLGA